MSLLDTVQALSSANVSLEVQFMRMVTYTNDTNASLDAFFLLTMAIIIYFMQCGFAFLEAGAVRSKNTTNILIKNILDSFFGCIAYYIIGYALAFGKNGNPFCGASYFALSYLPDAELHNWFFHFVFAATAATIVSGAVAERCEFLAYIVYSFVITGFIYPVASHWAWASDGWLSTGIKIGDATASYEDFAGSGVIHMTGGAAAFVGAVLLGPRIGRFDKDTKEPIELRGHSVPLASLGGFILFFGFFAFNGGSQAQISVPGDGAVVSIAMVNTILSGSIAAFTTLLLNRIRSPYWSLLNTINGALAGMVAICAGCNAVYPWGACIIGLFAALSYTLWSILMLKLGIDDPLDAVAVHFGGGLWGVLSVAFLKRETGILFVWNQASGVSFLIQLIGAVAFTAWSAGLCFLMFGLLKLLKVFRVSQEMEIKGLDYPKHGEMSYPLTAYGHGWTDEDAVPEIGAVQDLPELVANDRSFSHKQTYYQTQGEGYDNLAMKQQHQYANTQNGSQDVTPM